MGSAVSQLAGTFLEAAHPGGSKNKRIARLLACSPDMAKLLRRGEGWTVYRLELMARHYGPAFINFVYRPVFCSPAMAAEMDERDSVLAELVAERNAEDARITLAPAREGAVPRGAGASLGGAMAPPPDPDVAP